MTFSSNVIGAKFGRGGELLREWTCICEFENKSWHKNCWLCGISKSLAELANETEENDKGN